MQPGELGECREGFGCEDELVIGFAEKVPVALNGVDDLVVVVDGLHMDLHVDRSTLSSEVIGSLVE